MSVLLTQARDASRDAVDCLRTIKNLQAIGFTDAAFRRLHHQCGGMGEFCRYSDNRRYKYEGNNHRVHQRLMYVLLSCPDGAPPKGMTFQILADEAFKQIPPII